MSEAGSAETRDGAPGLPLAASGSESSDGVAVASSDASPAPTELMAVTRNTYSVPLSRPSTVCLVLVLPVSSSAVSNSSSPASLYSILYPVTGGELSSSGASHSSRTSSSDTSSASSDLGFPGSFCSGGDDDEVGLPVASPDHSPVPSSPIAATRYTYVVPVSRSSSS